MSCPTETPAVTLANSFFISSGKYVVTNFTTTKNSSGKNNTSCLPTSGTPPVSSFPRISINSDATINPGDLTAQVNKYLAENDGEAPTALTPSDNDPIGKFQAKSELLRAMIKSEFCYYQNRYAFMLNEFLLNNASKSTKSIADNQVDCVVYLNSVLTQILQMYQGIINSRNSTIRKYHTDSGININSLNSDIDTSRSTLKKQSDLLKQTSLTTDLQSAMIDYSLEKNQSSRNLLAIYGFMNLVAAGLLVYLYRSTKTQ